MPGTATEAVANEEGLNEDGDGEGDIGGDGTDREDSANGDTASEDQEQQADPDARVEPDGIDWCVCVLVDSLDPPGAGETSIASIGECDSRGGNHTPLAHRVGAHNCQAENCQSDLLRHDLNEIRSPWLAEVRTKDGRNIYHGVGNDQLQCPTGQTAYTGSHHDSSGRSDGGVAALFAEMEWSIVT